jgi:hypothetical protein
VSSAFNSLCFSSCDSQELGTSPFLSKDVYEFLYHDSVLEPGHETI